MDLADELARPREHQLQLAADGDELPPLGDPAMGVGGGVDVQAAGDLVAGRGLADPGQSRRRSQR